MQDQLDTGLFRFFFENNDTGRMRVKTVGDLDGIALTALLPDAVLAASPAGFLHQ